jgi:hypothetical protein
MCEQAVEAFRRPQTLDFADAVSRTIYRKQEDHIMNRRGMLISLAVVGLIGHCATGIAVAQEKQRVSMKTPAENTKYTQQVFIDVGDAPGHQVRVYEIHRTYPSNPPMFNGVKLVEGWTRGTSDYTDTNGVTTGYTVNVLENGDKFFERYSCIAQNFGAGKFTASCVGPITGGTGKFAGIRGVDRTVVAFDPKAGFNETQAEIEYWMEK